MINLIEPKIISVLQLAIDLFTLKKLLLVILTNQIRIASLTMEGINMNPQPNVKINVKEFAAKAQSKREVYSLLTIDCKAYLPKYETITIYYLKDLLSGVKKCK